MSEDKKQTEDNFITWNDIDQTSKARAFENFSNSMESYEGISKGYHRDFLDIEPNRSVRPQFGRSDYDAFRPNEATPRKQKRAIKLCMDAYEKVGIVRNIIDLMGDFGCQGINVVHESKSAEKFFKQWFKKVQGKERHVCSYLKDFMFDPSRANDSIHTLSGGQQNRLLLAKVLANPQTGLILDEPTNDLDLETMDLLTEMLTNYKGTLLIVSHDRDFLDQTVNKIIHFEGLGKISIFMGGYSDFLKKEEEKKSNNIKKSKNTSKKNEVTKIKNKLSFKFKYELENLPKEIEDIQLRINKINSELKNSNLYLNDIDRFNEITKDMRELKESLLIKEDRCLNLLEMEEKIA